MAEFIDKLPVHKINKLLEELKIEKTENIVETTERSAYGGKLYVVHGEDENGELIESIFTDFMIEKIYNSQPSDYDQMKFQSVMKELCGPVYQARAEKFNTKFGLNIHKFTYGEDDSDENEAD